MTGYYIKMYHKDYGTTTYSGKRVCTYVEDRNGFSRKKTKYIPYSTKEEAEQELERFRNNAGWAWDWKKSHCNIVEANGQRKVKDVCSAAYGL